MHTQKSIADQISDIRLWAERFDIALPTLSEDFSEIIDPITFPLIDATGKGVTYIPESISILSWLEILRLENNEIESIPESLFDLPNLVHVNLCGNKITEVPETLGNAKVMTSLGLGDNKIQSLPESIGNCSALEMLVIYDNPISALPKSLEQCVHLNFVNINGTAIDPENTIPLPDNRKSPYFLEPDALEKGEQNSEAWVQEIIDWSDRYELNLPRSLEILKKVTRLDASGRGITYIPEAIGKLTSLEIVDLSDNCISVLPDALFTLPMMTHLELQKNQITVIPESIGHATKLQHVLDISDNKIQELPDSIGNLHDLVWLDLRSNPIRQLPKSLEECTKLEVVEIEYTNIDPQNTINLPDNSAYPYYFYFPVSQDESTVIENSESPFFLSPEDEFGVEEWERMWIQEICDWSDLFGLNLPRSIEDLRSLEKLQCIELGLSFIPNAINELRSLKSVEFMRNLISEVPHSLFELPNLKFLNLAQNKITSLPESIGKCTTLKFMTIAYNPIDSLPTSIVNCNQMRPHIQKTNITEIPAEWEEFYRKHRTMDQVYTDPKREEA